MNQTTADIIEVLNRFAKPDLKEGGYTLHDSDFDKVANSLVSEPVEDEKEIAKRVIEEEFLKGIIEDDYPHLNVIDILHWLDPEDK